jgi:hypothetical protein
LDYRGGQSRARDRQQRNHSVSVSRRILVFVLVVITCGIIIGSLGPFDFRQNFGATWRRQLPLFGGLSVTPHRLFHFAAFGLLGILVVLISSRAYQLLLGLAAVITLGLSIESAQYLFSTNPFESWDLRDDICAACVGHFCTALFLYCAHSAKRSRLGMHQVRH